MILASHGLIASQITQVDADWLAYYNRVIAAGGSLTTTEQNATKQLVADLKANSLWTPMKAIYPMVGASAAACAQNLKSASFTGTFSSGWTFASTGVTPNGTSAYMDTGFNTSTNQTVNNFSLSAYIRTANMSGLGSDMGNLTLPTYLPLTNLESNATFRSQFCWDYTLGNGRADITTTDSRGMWGVSRSGASSWQSFERNTSVAKTTTTSASSLPNNNMYFGASNTGGTAGGFANREIAFGHLGNSLTNTQFNNFYTAVQAFQTTLSRQV
jgi:hypothetical protein